MTFVIFGLIVYAVASLILEVVSRSPSGYEDDDGFHFGE